MASQTEVYNRLVSNKGMFLVSDTEVYTAGFYGLVIREDSVISSWEDEDGRNLITYLGLSGKTLTSTDSALMIPGGKYNGSFSLSSGSAWLLGVTGATGSSGDDESLYLLDKEGEQVLDKQGNPILVKTQTT
jgi:hypothetical protein